MWTEYSFPGDFEIITKEKSDFFCFYLPPISCEVKRLKETVFYDKPSLFGVRVESNIANFSLANSTNVTNTTCREGDKADVPSVAGAIIIKYNHHQHHHLSLHSYTQSTGDKSCKVDASTPYQQQHLAGLFSGDWRLNWSLWPTIVCPVEDFPNIRSQW